MENAIEEAKQAADEVCASNENDGVAKWIKEKILAASCSHLFYHGIMLWPLPLFFFFFVSQYHKSFFVFGIMVLGLSFMLAVIRDLTGSVWLCVFCHAIVNSMSNFYHYDFYGSYFASSITTAVMIVISLLLILIFKKRKKIYKSIK